ncbi:MAG: HNH endonuclease [Candidatus Sericytochromatia bacterium]
MRKEYVERRKNAPGSHTQSEWEARVASYLHRCAYCGSNTRALVREHVVPVSAGGTNHIWNLVPACQSCNARKLDRTDFPAPSPPLVCCGLPIQAVWEAQWRAQTAPTE